MNPKLGRFRLNVHGRPEPESTLKAEVKEYLRERGAYFFMPVQTGYGSYTVDFLCCLDGKFVGIETKAVGRELTPRQKRTLTLIKQANGIAIAAWSLADVRKHLDV